MEACHPSFHKINELGCLDEVKILTAFYVYIELCEETRLWDVEYKYLSKLDVIYFLGKTSKNGNSEIYIPWPANSNMRLSYIEDIQRSLKTKSLTLVIKSNDGTSIFYKVSEGLVKPLSPSAAEQLKISKQKKIQLEKQITKNSSILYKLAQIDGNNGETSNAK